MFGFESTAAAGHDAVSAAPLGIVKAIVRNRVEGGRRDLVALERSAPQADRHPQRLAFKHEWGGSYGQPQPVGKPGTTIDGDSAQNNRKLLTPDPRDDVLGSDLTSHGCTNLAEQGIASGMPVLVVDALEEIHVDGD